MAKEKNKHDKLLCFLLALIVVLILVIGAGAYYFLVLDKGKNEAVANTNENTLSNTLAKNNTTNTIQENAINDILSSENYINKENNNELQITKYKDGTAEFSLSIYHLTSFGGKLDYISANEAVFSIKDSEQKGISGKVIFNEDAITVTFIDSENEFIRFGDALIFKKKTEKTDLIESDYIGEWTVEKTVYNYSDNNEANLMEVYGSSIKYDTGKLTLNNDNTFTDFIRPVTSSEISTEGKYTVSDNNIILLYNDGSIKKIVFNKEYHNEESENVEFRMEYHEDGDYYIIILKKGE